MLKIEVRRGGEWVHLTTVVPEQVGNHTERPDRVRDRARRMLHRWQQTYWGTRGENVTLRIV